MNVPTGDEWELASTWADWHPGVNYCRLVARWRLSTTSTHLTPLPLGKSRRADGLWDLECAVRHSAHVRHSINCFIFHHSGGVRRVVRWGWGSHCWWHYPVIISVNKPGGASSWDPPVTLFLILNLQQQVRWPGAPPTTITTTKKNNK